MQMINTVTGPVAIDKLGRTLMHEHLAVGFPGWETDRPGLAFRQLVAICVDRVEELKAAGFSTLLDPCPNDLGRDVTLMAEVATRTGFNIICSTGLYYDSGGLMHWKLKLELNPKAEEELTELFVREITDGVGSTGIKPGIIKLSSESRITNYDRAVMRAGAKAALLTGVPITTHTGAVLGDEQLQILGGCGVPAHRVIVGHSCGSNDHDYHMRIVKSGAYLGFDRFGALDLNSDENRVASMLRVIASAGHDQIIVSHDNVWCARGMEALHDTFAPEHGMLRFTRVIAPMLRRAGIEERKIDDLLISNPQRFFMGRPSR